MELTRKQYRRVNASLLVVCLAIFLIVYTLIEVRCFGSCGSELQLAFLNPVMHYAGGMSLILGLMYILRGLVFRRWLIYIASWYVPLSIFFIVQVNMRSDHMLAMDRGLAAAWWSAVLVVISIVFGICCVLYRWRKHDKYSY